VPATGRVLGASIVVHSEVLLGADLTQRIGLKPTDVMDLGTIDDLGRVREFTAWVLESEIGVDAPLDEHLTWLLDTIAPANNRLRGLIATEQASVRIEAVVAHVGRHRMTFLNDLLDKLAEFPGHFWLTAYSGEREE
jgi:Domain of unknown function (DUF4279)